MSIVTRFAPSPTGHLHLGHAYAAWRAWRRARDGGGMFLLRLEDIDAARCRPAYAVAILEDLRWLGLDWDGPVRVQSEHLPEYAAALARLAQRDLLYPCFCTRGEIAQVLNDNVLGAPHGSALPYPGTCRALSAAERAARIARGLPYALRLDVRAALAEVGGLKYIEENTGPIAADPLPGGDIVLARKDSPISYHLCVVHDDALQGVTHITRGRDLAPATPVQVLLQRLLGLPTPIYAHHDLLLDAAGKRLAKRDGAISLRALRMAGETPEMVLRQLREFAS